MRSRFGVGMTPPKVLGTPYPWSSVMMSRTFGAPLGGTMRGGHHGVESLALSLITPPNFGGGGGICFPSIEVVALGEPGVPVTCCAATRAEVASPNTARNTATRIVCPIHLMSALLCFFFLPEKWPGGFFRRTVPCKLGEFAMTLTRVLSRCNCQKLRCAAQHQVGGAKLWAKTQELVRLETHVPSLHKESIKGPVVLPVSGELTRRQ